MVNIILLVDIGQVDGRHQVNVRHQMIGRVQVVVGYQSIIRLKLVDIQNVIHLLAKYKLIDL